MGTAAEFALEIDQELEFSLDEWRLIIRRIAREALKRVVEKTPVGNPDLWKGPAPSGYVGGTARNNWYVSLGEAGFEVSTVAEESGNVALLRGDVVFARYRQLNDFDFPDIVIYNNLPYINRLEFDGWSTQAPNGMVQPTVDELQVRALT